jgi:hypothetical protein
MATFWVVSAKRPETRRAPARHADRRLGARPPHRPAAPAEQRVRALDRASTVDRKQDADARDDRATGKGDGA